MAIKRSKLMAPAVVLLLTVGSIAGVWGLLGRTNASHQAELQVSSLILSVADLQSAPFNADRAAGGSAALIQSRIAADEQTISRGLTTRSQRDIPVAVLIAGRSDLASIKPVVAGVYQLAVQSGGLSAARPASRVPTLQRELTVRSEALSRVLVDLSRRDAARAALARTQTKFGAAGAMLLLLLAFAYLLLALGRGAGGRRAPGSRQKEALLGVSRVEARTDALTELGNRRALASDLADAIPGPTEVTRTAACDVRPGRFQAVQRHLRSRRRRRAAAPPRRPSRQRAATAARGLRLSDGRR